MPQRKGLNFRKYVFDKEFKYITDKSPHHLRYMEQPDITVLIPNFNSARFVRRTLQSLKEQSYKNFYIYLVDDGSSDNSLLVAQEFQKEMPNLRILSFENIGITANWNRSINLVETDFCTLLHCDDEYTPNYLEEMRRLMIKYGNAAVGHCGAVTIDKDSNIMRSPVEAYKRNRYFRALNFCYPVEIEFRRLVRENYITCPSAFFRTRYIQEIGPFNESYRMVSDWEYWCRTLLNGFHICGSRKLLFRYRRHGSNTTKNLSATLERYNEEYRFLNWVHEQGREKGWIKYRLPNFSFLLKSIILDVSGDLANNDKEAAKIKLNYLVQKMPQLRFRPIYFGLYLIISFGRAGGWVLNNALLRFSSISSLTRRP